MTAPGHKRISTAAYQALRDALPVIVWYKDSFRRYLRTALRDHPEILAGLDFNSNKHAIADEVVDRLKKHENVYPVCHIAPHALK
jgi:hypothetical protein